MQAQRQEFLVFNPNTMYVMKKSNRWAQAISNTKGGASRMLSGAIKAGRAKEGEYIVGTREEFNAMDEMVEVKNMMSGTMVKIRKSERGGCCDPSTERYWTM